MEPGDRQVRREARTVEIGAAALMGGLIAVVPNVVLWLTGLPAGISGPAWDSAQRTVQLVAIVAGAAMAVWWLLRARRSGL